MGRRTARSGSVFNAHAQSNARSVAWPVPRHAPMKQERTRHSVGDGRVTGRDQSSGATALLDCGHSRDLTVSANWFRWVCGRFRAPRVAPTSVPGTPDQGPRRGDRGAASAFEDTPWQGQQGRSGALLRRSSPCHRHGRSQRSTTRLCASALDIQFTPVYHGNRHNDRMTLLLHQGSRRDDRFLHEVDRGPARTPRPDGSSAWLEHRAQRREAGRGVP